MKKINCLGDMCPVPLLKLKKELVNLKNQASLMIVTDHSCVFESIKEYANNNSLKLEVQEPLNGIWEITISN